MKINDIQRIGAINPYRKNNGHASDKAYGKKGVPKDEVLISSEAKELLSAHADSAQRAKKVQELKQSVMTGTYHVDAGKIAEKLLPYIK